MNAARSAPIRGLTGRGTARTPGGTVVALRDPFADPRSGCAHAELKETLARAVESGERRFVLDFAGVPRVDCAMLGLCVELLRRVRSEGGVVWAAGAGPSVRRAFALTCLTRVLPMADTVPEALACLFERA